MTRIALIQQRVTGDRRADLARGVTAVVAAADRGATIAAFAELAFEPFHPRVRAAGDVAALAETIPGPTTDELSRVARACGIVVVANLFERDGDRTFDTSPVIDADGSLLGRTRMVHITDYDGFHEQGYYAPGDTGAPVYETAAGRIGVAICYDRHYPEYMRALALGGAELVIVPQAGTIGEWPDGLYEAEMQVAAFQNGYFVALVNRVGGEGRLTFAGESFVCAPDGRVVARAPGGQDAMLEVDVDFERVRDSHGRTLFLRDRRPELYAAWFTASETTRPPG